MSRDFKFVSAYVLVSRYNNWSIISGGLLFEFPQSFSCFFVTASASPFLLQLELVIPQTLSRASCRTFVH